MSELQLKTVATNENTEERLRAEIDELKRQLDERHHGHERGASGRRRRPSAVTLWVLAALGMIADTSGIGVLLTCDEESGSVTSRMRAAIEGRNGLGALAMPPVNREWLTFATPCGFLSRE